MSTFVSQPSLPGTENSAFSASDAGPAAAMPARVRTIQTEVTIFLWASTQRVRTVMPRCWSRGPHPSSAERRLFAYVVRRTSGGHEAGLVREDDELGTVAGGDLEHRSRDVGARG